MTDESSLLARLEAEKQKNARLEATVADLRLKMGRLEISMEAEGERIAMTLSRKLEKLKAEKARLAMDVEREEEYITNRLQKRLAEVTREKMELEQNVEVEQERLVNSLQRRLDAAQRESLNLRRRISTASTESPSDAPVELSPKSPRDAKPKGAQDTRRPVPSSPLTPHRRPLSPIDPLQLAEMDDTQRHDRFVKIMERLEAVEYDCKHGRMEIADLRRGNEVLREEIRRLRETNFVVTQKLRAAQEVVEAHKSVKSPTRRSIGMADLDQQKLHLRARGQSMAAGAGRARLYRSFSYKGDQRAGMTAGRHALSHEMKLPHEKEAERKEKEEKKE